MVCLSTCTWTGADGAQLLCHLLAAVSNNPEENRKRADSILAHPNDPDKWYRQVCTEEVAARAFLHSLQQKYPPGWFDLSGIWHADERKSEDQFQQLLLDTIDQLQDVCGESSDASGATPTSSCTSTGRGQHASASHDCVQAIESSTNARCVAALTFERSASNKIDAQTAKVHFCQHLSKHASNPDAPGKPSKATMVLIENMLLELLPGLGKSNKSQFIKKVVQEITTAYDKDNLLGP